MEKRIDFRILQQSPDFKVTKPELEQYATPPDIVIEIVKQAYTLGHLDGTVADLGCGTGRLAIGAALTGAKVTGYEIDIEALDLAKKYSNAQKKLKFLLNEFILPKGIKLTVDVDPISFN